MPLELSSFHSFRDISISGFDGHVAISGCRSLSQLFVDTLFGLAMVENPEFAVGIYNDICHTVEDISTSGLDGHIAISGCPSVSHLFVDTFLSAWRGRKLSL